MKTTMPSSLEYVKRFSMCNCLTIPMPDTYTAHAMTVDFFLEKAAPGRKVVVDVPDERPGDEARAFKIPRRIDTFLFSPFNEAFHEAYEIGGVRYTCVGDVLGKTLRSLPRQSPNEFGASLSDMDARVTTMWGGALKILVLYDGSMAGREARFRLGEYDDAAADALRWPVVQVRGGTSSKYAGRVARGLWHHYVDAVKADVLGEIEAVEDTRNG